MRSKKFTGSLRFKFTGSPGLVLSFWWLFQDFLSNTV